MKWKTEQKFYQASTSELYGLVKESPQTEKPRLIQGVPTQPQNFMHIGLQKTTGMHIIFLLVMEYYLIMKVLEEEKHLLRENN